MTASTTARVVCRDDDGHVRVHRVDTTSSPNDACVDHITAMSVDMSDALQDLERACGFVASLSGGMGDIAPRLRLPSGPTGKTVLMELLSTAIVTHGSAGNPNLVMRHFQYATPFSDTRNDSPDVWAWWAVTHPINMPAFFDLGLRTPAAAHQFITATGPYDTTPTNPTDRALRAWTALGVRTVTDAAPWVERGVNGGNVIGVAGAGIRDVAGLPADFFTQPVNDLDEWTLTEHQTAAGDATELGLGVAAYAGLLRVAGDRPTLRRFIEAGIVNPQTIHHVVGPTVNYPAQQKRSPLTVADLPVIAGLCLP